MLKLILILYLFFALLTIPSFCELCQLDTTVFFKVGNFQSDIDGDGTCQILLCPFLQHNGTLYVLLAL